MTDTDYLSQIAENTFDMGNTAIEIQNALTVVSTQIDGLSTETQNIQSSLSSLIESNPVIMGNLAYISDCGRIIAGLLLAFIVMELCKYTYKFFNMFFPMNY